MSVQVYTNQVASPSFTTQGSDVTDAHVQTDCGLAVFWFLSALSLPSF